MSRWAVVLPLAMLVAALWWYHGVATDYRLFGGTLAFALDVVASVLTALLCVIVAEALVGLGIIAARTAQPTGFERTGFVVVTGALAVFLVLAHFGVNLATMLATSALLTAIIGLALQPTLGALIAGFTLGADRVLKVGDAVIQGTEAVTVTAIGWRSVIGTKGDGTRTVISNSRILDGTADVVPKGASAKGETVLLLPLADEPETIIRLVTDVVADLPLVDIRLPVRVGPVSVDPERAQARYKIEYWARAYEDRSTIATQIAARLWYVFQREGIAWPVSAAYATDYRARLPTLSAAPWNDRMADALTRLAEAGAAKGLKGLTPETVAETATLLLYGDAELVEMPDRVEGCRCLLVHGTVRVIATEFEGASAHEVAMAHASRTSHRAALKALSERLARDIGPFAEFAVQRAAVAHADLDTIAATVAMEIGDERERRNFAPPAGTRALQGPGLLFDLRRGATGALHPAPLLRAQGPVGIVALPRGLRDE